MQSIIEANILTMSSLEIAELCGKEHKNVMRDVKVMLEELDIAALRFERGYKDTNNQERPCFELPKDLTYTLVSGYNTSLLDFYSSNKISCVSLGKFPQRNLTAEISAVRFVQCDGSSLYYRLFT